MFSETLFNFMFTETRFEFMFSENLFNFMFTETRFEFMFSETVFDFMFTGLMSFGNPLSHMNQQQFGMSCLH